MFFDLDKLEIEIKHYRHFGRGMTFSYNGEDYYFKTLKNLDNIYNEIVAKRIADRVGIDCCEYYLACFEDNLGSVSKMFSKEHYYSMSTILQNVYGLDQNRNNIEDINYIFDKYHSVDTAERLKKELIDIFLFDALIGNCDRNSDNYGLIIDSNTRFAPLYDNENMLSDYAIYDGDYSLEISRNDKCNMLYKLLDNNEYAKERLKEMLFVIDEDSLEEIFVELSKDYEINPFIKEKILDKFSINRDMINNYYKEKVKVYEPNRK